MPAGPLLMLDTLRWPTEVRPFDDLRIPAAGKSAASLKESELKMARQLIAELTRPWKPEDYHDQFPEAIHKLVRAKVEAGETEKVTPFEALDEEAWSTSNVVDLTALLKDSLGKRRGHARGEEAANEAAPAPAPKARA